MVSSSSSNSGTRRVNLVINPVISQVANVIKTYIFMKGSTMYMFDLSSMHFVRIRTGSPTSDIGDLCRVDYPVKAFGFLAPKRLSNIQETRYDTKFDIYVFIV